MKLVPYLNYNGTCEEAFRFYASVLGGEVAGINYYEGSPMEVPAGMEKKVMHAAVLFEDNEIMGADDVNATEMPANSPMMLNFMEVFVMDRIFNGLAQGGTITMPLQDTFWGARFGAVTDKFGIRWMFNCELN